MADIEDNIRHTDEMQDIMGKMPPWLIRKGAVVMSLIMIVFIIASIVIQYPDLQKGPIEITCENPPATLVAQTDGRIKLLCQDNKTVAANEFVAVIENTADIKDIYDLRTHLPFYKEIAEHPVNLINPLVLKKIPTHSNLGELQEDYLAFKKACDAYQLFLSLHQNQSKIANYQNQINLLSRHDGLLKEKENIHNRQYKILSRAYNNDADLYAKKVISQIEFDKTEESLLNEQHKMQSLKEEILTNEEQISKLNGLVSDLFITDKDEKIKLEFEIKSSYKTLEMAYNSWERKYIIKSPIAGKISFFDFWNNNQYIKAGADIAYIISQPGKVFGRLKVSGAKFGKVKTGQKVRILLDNYPHTEYGIIYGKVESISEVNKDNIYLTNIALPDGLVTSYQKNIPFRHEMKGNGEIVTEDLSIIQRLFYHARAIL